MKTTIDDMRLYDGRGRGTITLDGSQQASANIGANITLENISGQPLLKDAADIDKLAGKAASRSRSRARDRTSASWSRP